ncbi:MAG: efflux RND transporter permease subunit [Lachnospirales bacterium]
MNIIKMSVKRPVTTTMILLIVVVFGVLSFLNINLDMLPNMNIPVAIVQTSYSGVGSEEIENLITEPLEGALGTITGVDTLQSISSYGSSIIILTFEDTVDIDFAALDMREAVEMVSSYLPEGASDPMVLKIDITQMSSIMIGAKSETKSLVELQTIVDDKILNRLERQDGVANVTTSGGKEKEVMIELDEQKMLGYGISEQTVIGLLAAENYTIPVGNVQQGDKNLPIKVVGELDNLVDIENIIIPTSNGTVFLADIAEIEFNYKEQDSKGIIDGNDAILINISKQSTANAVDVSKNLVKEIENINNEMEDVELIMLIDSADYIEMSLNNVTSSALIGGVLAVIILLIFLNDIRAALIVGVAMPVSIISTFLLMNFAGFTLNMMSLGGLALGIGMLVDNSIVVIESIYRKLENGYSKTNAAILGAKEVAAPVISSTLTTVAVFLPLTFAGGLAAEIFNELSFTISFSLGSSLVIALTFVPMASSLFLQTTEEKELKKGKVNPLIQGFQNFFVKLESGYKNVLEKALTYKKTVVLIVVIFIVATAGLAAATLGFVMIPEMDEGLVTISVSLPEGTELKETEEKLNELVERYIDLPEVDNMTIMIGGGDSASMLSGSSSTNSGTIYMFLTDVTERDRKASEIATYVNRDSKSIPGADISASGSSMSMGSFGGSTVDIQVYGDELDTIAEVVTDLSLIVSKQEGVGAVSTSIASASPQAEVYVDKQKATAYGINSTAISSTIQTAIQGSVATTYRAEGTEFDVRVSQGKDNFNYLTDLENISIATAMGTNIPLSDIAEIKVVDIPVSINRMNQQRYETISIGTGDLDTGSVKTYFEEQMQSYIMPEGYYWAYTGTAEEMAEIFTSLGYALVAAILIVYMVMAAQFESYKYPFIVMFSLPIAMTGGLFGLVVINEDFSMTSFMGLIMLAGIVINNAIVLIDYTNTLIKEDGFTPKDALLQAGPIRLRPILMSTLTTVLGLVPMLLSKASGSEMMKGLSTIVIFGLTLSTLVTLILIPVIYLTVNERDERRLEKRYRRRATKLGISYEEYVEMVNNTKNDRVIKDSPLEENTKEFD